MGVIAPCRCCPRPRPHASEEVTGVPWGLCRLLFFVCVSVSAPQPRLPFNAHPPFLFAVASIFSSSVFSLLVPVFPCDLVLYAARLPTLVFFHLRRPMGLHYTKLMELLVSVTPVHVRAPTTPKGAGGHGDPLLCVSTARA